MDGDAARRIIYEQNSIAYERLRLPLVEQGRQADAVAEGLLSWKGRAWVSDPERRTSFGFLKAPTGHIDEAAVQAIVDAYAWAQSSRILRVNDYREYLTPIGSKREESWYRIKNSLNGIIPWHKFPEFDVEHFDSYVFRFDNFDLYRGELTRCRRADRNGVDAAILLLCESIKRLASSLKNLRLPEQVIEVPPELHPPRIVRLPDGALARVLTEDLAILLNDCRTLLALPAGGAALLPRVLEWRDRACELLGTYLGKSEAFRFRDMMSGAHLLGNEKYASNYVESLRAAISDARSLGAAYLTLGLIYLEGVKRRVSDYAEASEQGTPQPTVSMTFSGGTFYGGQFAAQIENKDSIIAGVVQSGGAEVAHALQVLEQAILTQQELTREQRQDLLDNIEYLAQAAQTPPEKRNQGAIRSVMAAVTAAATTGSALGDAIETWSALLHRFFT